MRGLLDAWVPLLTCINSGYRLEKSFGSWECSGNEPTLLATVSTQSLPDPGHNIDSDAVVPLKVTPFKWLSLSLSLRFLAWLKSPDRRLRLGLFLSATSLWLLLTLFGSGTLLGGAGLKCNWGTGEIPKLGLAPNMADAFRALFDGSGRLGTKIKDN